LSNKTRCSEASHFLVEAGDFGGIETAGIPAGAVDFAAHRYCVDGAAHHLRLGHTSVYINN
jgi:hypothetical protein